MREGKGVWVMELIDGAVRPALDELQIRYQIDDETLHTVLPTEAGAVLISIRQFKHPSLVWLRFSPAIFIQQEQKDGLLETGLGINYQDWLIKVGRDARDGELVFDVELPLLHGVLTKESFTTYFVLALDKVQDALKRLAKVRWGGLSPKQALGKANSPESRTVQPPSPRRRRKTKLEREIEGLLNRLESRDSGETEDPEK
jgi:hypothetical protein